MYIASYCLIGLDYRSDLLLIRYTAPWSFVFLWNPRLVKIPHVIDLDVEAVHNVTDLREEIAHLANG